MVGLLSEKQKHAFFLEPKKVIVSFEKFNKKNIVRKAQAIIEMTLTQAERKRKNFSGDQYHIV